MIFYIVLFTFASYLLGSIPTGLVLGNLFSNKDIRESGSGNIGATNATRVLGKKFGILTFAGDALKGVLPVIAGTYIFQPVLPAFKFQFVICAFGFAAFLGHLFPLYLKFRGGKGVATAFGIFLCLEPIAIMAEIVVFAVTVFLWRYVSLGSLIASAAMPFILLSIAYFVRPVSMPGILLSIVICLLIFVKHKSNIQRLLEGKENKIGQRK
jgi:glycerol-3-phosphate acyltransferase PlsY